MSGILRLLTVVWALLVLLEPAYSQELAPIPIEELLGAREFPTWTQTRLSPDKQWVAYTLQDSRRRKTGLDTRVGTPSRTHSGVPGIVLGSDVCLTNLRTKETRNLTNGRGSSWAPVWSPDGRRLAFYSDRAGAVNLWIWNKVSGSLHIVPDLIVRTDYSFEAPQWTPDATRLVTKALPPERRSHESKSSINAPLSYLESEQHSESGSKSTVMVYRGQVDPLPTLPLNESTSDEWSGDLVVIDLEGGGIRRLTKGLRPMWFRLSPDGKDIALTTRLERRTKQGLESLADLVVIDLLKEHSHIVARQIKTFYGVNFSWSPDGKWLAYTTTELGNGTGWTGECFVIAVAGGEPRNLTPPSHPEFVSDFSVPLWDVNAQNFYLLSSCKEPPLCDGLWRFSVTDATPTEVVKLSQPKFIEMIASPGTGRFWSPDGGRSMVVMIRDTETMKNGFYSVDLETSKYAKLFDEDRSYGVNGITWSIDVSGDGRCAVYRAQDTRRGEDIWMFCVDDMGSTRRITDVNPQFDRYVMGSGRLVKWTNSSGLSLRGALLLPAGYQEGKRYPLIVYPYPGASKSMFLNQFGMSDMPNDNMQLFATRGYAVLYPDAPFEVGMEMVDIEKAVIPGVDKVIELGIADPDRVGLMGHSWGGYAVLSLIVQTIRFKAAVSRSGVGGDLIRYSTLMQPDGHSIGMTETELFNTGGTLWEKRDTYIDNSPLFFLHKVQTPLLLTHGTMDPVSATLSDEIFVSLRRLGKEVEYAKYEGEDHFEFDWRYANQVDFLSRIVRWFDEHLKQPSMADNPTHVLRYSSPR